MSNKRRRSIELCVSGILTSSRSPAQKKRKIEEISQPINLASTPYDIYCQAIERSHIISVFINYFHKILENNYRQNFQGIFREFFEECINSINLKSFAITAIAESSPKYYTEKKKLDIINNKFANNADKYSEYAAIFHRFWTEKVGYYAMMNQCPIVCDLCAIIARYLVSDYSLHGNNNNTNNTNNKIQKHVNNSSLFYAMDCRNFYFAVLKKITFAHFETFDSEQLYLCFSVFLNASESLAMGKIIKNHSLDGSDLAFNKDVGFILDLISQEISNSIKNDNDNDLEKLDRNFYNKVQKNFTYFHTVSALERKQK